MAWIILSQAAESNAADQFRNLVTGRTSTRKDLADRANGYLARQLVESTFQQFLSIFESFLFDFLRIWLSHHPGSLGKKQLEVRTILELDPVDRDSVVAAAAEKELNEINYRKPAEWFANLEGIVHLGVPSKDEIERLTEAKALRDVLSHNRGVANRVYVAKSGVHARFRVGQRIQLTDDHHIATWELLNKMAGGMADAALSKQDA